VEDGGLHALSCDDEALGDEPTDLPRLQWTLRGTRVWGTEGVVGCGQVEGDGQVVVVRGTVRRLLILDDDSLGVQRAVWLHPDTHVGG
jgi:hypothetical protein